MKRGWFLLLAVSIGLNAGLLYMTFAARRSGADAWDLGRTAAGDSLRAPEMHGRLQGRGGPAALDPRAMAEHRLSRLESRLNLVPEQSARVRTLLEEKMPRILELRERAAEARRAVQQEYLTPSPDPARLRLLVEQANRAQAVLDSLVAETILAETATLTPQQRQCYMQAMPWSRHWSGSPHGGPGAQRRMMHTPH
jgi:Spy/CpxP family protein refolding chaperone